MEALGEVGPLETPQASLLTPGQSYGGYHAQKKKHKQPKYKHLRPVSQKTKETTSQKNTKTKASRTVYRHNTLEEACDLGVFLSKYFCPHLFSHFFPNFE